jgi:hypothetical protein
MRHFFKCTFQGEAMYATYEGAPDACVAFLARMLFLDPTQAATLVATPTTKDEVAAHGARVLCDVCMCESMCIHIYDDFECALDKMLAAHKDAINRIRPFLKTTRRGYTLVASNAFFTARVADIILILHRYLTHYCKIVTIPANENVELHITPYNILDVGIIHEKVQAL